MKTVDSPWLFRSCRLLSLQCPLYLCSSFWTPFCNTLCREILFHPALGLPQQEWRSSGPLEPCALLWGNSSSSKLCSPAFACFFLALVLGGRFNLNSPAEVFCPLQTSFSCYTAAIWSQNWSHESRCSNTICALRFIAALLTTTERWKCPLKDEWTNKCGLSIQWYITSSSKGVKYWYMLQHG